MIRNKQKRSLSTDFLIRGLACCGFTNKNTIIIIIGPFWWPSCNKLSYLSQSQESHVPKFSGGLVVGRRCQQTNVHRTNLILI